MTKKEETAAAEIEVAEAESVAKSEEEEVEAEDIDIDGGFLQKRSTNPLNPWNKRYFAFGTEPVSLDNLKTVHKRNERRVKKVPAPAPAAEAPPTSEVAAGKAPAKDAAPAAPAAPAKTVEEVYEEANRDLLVNVAQANTKGTGLLYYHKSDDELHRQNVLGIINLRDVNSVERVEKSSKNRSFVVNTKNRDYHFSAESPQKAKGWVKAIKEKSDEAKAQSDPYSSPEFQEVYKKLVAREAFEHAKNSAAILADNEINSDGEPDDIEIENGTPVVKKRKSFFGFSAVATSHEKKKADGVTTEVSTEKKQDVTHVQEGDVDALKTHESDNAVSHTTDGPSTPAVTEAPKSPKAKSGGFKLFGKKAPKVEEPPAAVPEHPLTVDEAKADALKAVDDAVEASKSKSADAKKDTPVTPPAAEKKPNFLSNLFHKKPAAPPAAPATPNEETIVVSSEKSLSDVVSADGEVTSQSTGGFFSRVTKGKDKNEVEVKSGEVTTEDVVSAEGSTHKEHIEGTDASVANENGEQHVDLSTKDETIATSDKIERKPSLLSRLSGAVRPKKEAAASEDAPAAKEETVVEETSTETETKTETETETETVVKETAVAEATPEAAPVEAAA
ncbi:hypothetical protein BGZ99_000574 [Dissophora globulifera]|uniref:PH domain-containing protein n=1 Tax=Dissophora globulifera TaxID=979702 RepID=A0A9P6RS92_9FUNG|nr:hypothetical protein BGZ99_000574 [Dissophora globulifera]